MIQFIYGMNTMGFLAAGLFFWRFWHKTADALFVAFSAAFLLFALDQFFNSLQASPPSAHQLGVFLPSCRVRLADLRGAAKKPKMTQGDLTAAWPLLRGAHASYF